MYTITLWQPWASLIADGVKQYETRSWKPPWNLIGKRIAIHAAKRKITEQEFYVDLEGKVRWEMYFRYGLKWNKEIPYGAIVATAELVGFFQIEGYADKTQSQVVGLWEDRHVIGQRETINTDPFGDYSPGRYAWWLQSVIKLEAPVPAQGKQGIWKCDVE